MASAKTEDGKKWIYSFVALVSLIVAYVSISFLTQMSEWFDLEARIDHFVVVTQFVGIAVGLITFIAIIKNNKAHSHIREVYGELSKVIWPDRESVTKLTIGIVIGVVIASGAFLLIDVIFRKLLQFIY